MLLGGIWEHPGRNLKNGSKKVPFLCNSQVIFVTIFGNVSEKGHQKMNVFLDPLLSAENRPQAPQKVHSGASNSQKAPKMDPNSDTFGDLWKVDFCCYLQCFRHSGASFLGPGTPKSCQRQL